MIFKEIQQNPFLGSGSIFLNWAKYDIPYNYYSFTQHKETISLLAIGAPLIVLALLFSPVYPIVKNIWTVTFNMLTAGISFILMAIIIYIC